MSKLKELLTNEDLDQALESSAGKPVFLFKQSTTCPISAAAFSEFNNFLEASKEDFEPYFVKVRETREVSNKLAEEVNVEHQSPQVLLVKNKEVLWHTSHNKITVDSLTEALAENK